MSFGLMVHCVIIDKSSGDTLFEVSPICMTRLVADTIG
jgi:hypothetical protein